MTAVRACILIEPVTIIAGFDLCANHAVAAPCRRTIGETTITILKIAVITNLSFLHDAIATSGRFTGVGACIGRILIAIIAALARP
tara:strand:+ start:1008 stop:1265 length:258 start_codon:yes stop_codon:yes gene_type:complete